MGLGLAAVMAVTGCSVKETNAPDVTGPSELGLSIKVTATPDVLTMDGLSQSTVVIEARNSQGQPVSSLGFRAEVVAGGEIRDDAGRLSSKTGVTSSDGRATLTYTAPPSPTSGNSDSGNLVVTIRVVPASNDYSNALPRTVDIRLVPQGAILPLPNNPIAAFTFTPTGPAEGQVVQFDASISRDCPPDATAVEQCPVGAPTLTDFAWDFGDGSRGNGIRSSHTYARSGSYTVTLVVTNQRGLQNTTSKFVTVGVSADPTAAFASSPSAPGVNESVFFNASASKATGGRSLVGYDWTFGDGGTGSGVTTSHRYSRTGSFTVTLTVTDDIGKKGTTSSAVSVGGGAVPTAVIALSPQAPTVNQNVNFDGSQSVAPSGRSIRSYEWAFGDGTTASGVRVDHRYISAGQFTVILTVTDDTGAKGSANATVSVSTTEGQVPTASFTISPTTGGPNVPFTFDASGSTAQTGATIAVYEWNFGDSLNYFQCPATSAICSADGKRATHAYATVGTYVVTLVVTDNQGRKATTSRSVVVKTD
jgi:PKD repeat protein